MKIICWLLGHKWSEWQQVEATKQERVCARCRVSEDQFKLKIGATITVKEPPKFYPPNDAPKPKPKPKPEISPLGRIEFCVNRLEMLKEKRTSLAAEQERAWRIQAEEELAETEAMMSHYIEFIRQNLRLQPPAADSPLPERTTVE